MHIKKQPDLLLLDIVIERALYKKNNQGQKKMPI
jgi:hypothetical protein